MMAKEHATSRVGHHVQELVVVCPAATAAALSAERACGAEPLSTRPTTASAPAGCSGDLKQQRVHTIAITDRG